ncbi:MAG: pyrroline-5-carboxylate reductase [Rhodospirillales bacterium]
MGGALLRGWLQRGVEAARVTVVEPDREAAAAFDRLGVAVVAGPDAIAAGARPDVVVFAVKPQVVAAAVPAYARFVAAGAVFLSIAAGKTIAAFETALGTEAAVVRAMPNTPAAIGRGISVACANDRTDAGQRALCSGLLEAVGDVAWMGDEALMDAVTAVSGSGPAYVFLLVECLAAAGVEIGLPAELAERLARATVAGAGELLHRCDDSPRALRQAVTSPGGTTAAAIAVLTAADGLQPLLTAAVAAARDRSRDLAG